MRKFYEMQRGSRPWYVFLFLGVLVGTLLVLVADFNTPVPIPYGIISLVGAIYLGINLLVIAWHRLRFRRKFPHHELISNVFADQLKAVAAGHEYVFIPAEVDIPPEKVENIRWALLNYPPTKYLRDDDDDGVSEADRWRQANILARSLNRYKLTTDPRMLDDALIDLLASFKRPEELAIVAYKESRGHYDNRGIVIKNIDGRQAIHRPFDISIATQSPAAEWIQKRLYHQADLLKEIYLKGDWTNFVLQAACHACSKASLGEHTFMMTVTNAVNGRQYGIGVFLCDAHVRDLLKLSGALRVAEKKQEEIQ